MTKGTVGGRWATLAGSWTLLFLIRSLLFTAAFPNPDSRRSSTTIHKARLSLPEQRVAVTCN
jgi:hypothetical protein